MGYNIFLFWNDDEQAVVPVPTDTWPCPAHGDVVDLNGKSLEVGRRKFEYNGRLSSITLYDKACCQ